jgi:hypothetical protein
MGQLTFQATLGGAVNLVGPNTASNFNLNVPAVASTIATLAAQTFAGTQTFTVDAVVNGLTVGRGLGAVATNSALGSGALQANTSGAENTAVGYQAMYQTTSGGTNTSLGVYAGYSTTTGTGNTSVGHGSGFNIGNGTGSNNTFLGTLAGSQMTSGSKNVIIGSYTGASGLAPISATGSNFVVLSDGDGNVVASVKTAQTFALQGAIPNSGTGITFPATQSASSDANTLDDYEEGTFTPTLGGASSDPTVTYSSQQASYTKIGRVVTVCVNLSPLTYSGGSGNLLIKGLPFAVAVFSVGTALTSGVNFSTRTWGVAYSGGSNVTYFRLVGSGSNIGDYDVTTGDVSATDSITCTLTYYTA